MSDLTPAPEVPPPPSKAISPANKGRVMTGFLVSIFLIIFGSIIAVYLSRVEPPQGGVHTRALLDPPASPQLSPSPFPFQEMTIPSLRERKFDSQLGERQRISGNGSYTSYLSSYDSDGLKINGLLTIPDGQMPTGGWPAIVFIHGYIPPTQYQTTTRYLDHVAALARSGFVVFKIDLRGHGKSEGEPGGGYFGVDYVVDALNARAALQGADFVNKDKIGFWGHSMAGNIVLRSMAARPEIPAGVIWAGAVYTYTDMQEYGIRDNSYTPLPSDTPRQQNRARLRELYGNPSKDSWFWQLVAPANYLKDIKGALQIDHAINDDVVTIEYSRNLAKLAEEAKMNFELNEFTSGGHNITGSSFNAAMQNTINFFNKYLK
jgi:dipeptidyl aminopeptidase/acylaminoacyl peptidase